MAYVFQSVTVLLAAALILYLILLAVSWSRPEEKCLCQLEYRQRETQFDRVAVRRREHTQYSLIFRTNEGRRIEVRVSEDVYQLVPKEQPGTLCHKGVIFRWFACADTTIYYYTLLEDDRQKTREEKQP